MKKRLLNLMLLTLAPFSAMGNLEFFNGGTPSDNAVSEASWLDAIGIDASQIQHIVDFESGFTAGQNITNQPGLLPGTLVITNQGNNADIHDGSFGGSSANGQFAVRSNELAFLTFEFTTPVDYFALSDIDQASTSIIVTLSDDTTINTNIETTGTGGQSGEFWGVWRNDELPIKRIEMDATGDGTWGVDDLRYGVVPEPATASMLLGLCSFAAIIAWRRRTARS